MPPVGKNLTNRADTSRATKTGQVDELATAGASATRKAEKEEAEPAIELRQAWLDPFMRSQIGAGNSLLALKKFPIRPSREFGVQVTENAAKIRPKNRPGGALLRKFPVKFPVGRDFGREFSGCV
jgi:hypothetical protein